MGTEVLVAIALTITQVTKSWIQTQTKKWLEWKGWMTVALSFLVSYGVVAYNIIDNELVFVLWPFIKSGFFIFALANGGKKILNSLAKKIGNK